MIDGTHDGHGHIAACVSQSALLAERLRVGVRVGEPDAELARARPDSTSLVGDTSCTRS